MRKSVPHLRVSTQSLFQLLPYCVVILCVTLGQANAQKCDPAVDIPPKFGCDPNVLALANNPDAVTRLGYCVVHDRDPINNDPHYHDWEHLLDQLTISTHDFLMQAWGSPEFQAQVGKLNNESFVKFLYIRLLRRCNEENPTGWLSNLNAKKMTRTAVFNGIISSVEFKTKYPGLQLRFGDGTGPVEPPGR